VSSVVRIEMKPVADTPPDGGTGPDAAVPAPDGGSPALTDAGDAGAPPDVAVDAAADGAPADVRPLLTTPPDGGHPNGVACGDPSHCRSGNCVDGMCCELECRDPCQSCGTGVCLPVRNGPDRECAAPNMCDSQGVCASPPLNVPKPLRPFNGEATGSVHSARALRPRFQWIWAKLATRYELEIDDSCSVGDFATCTFPSPEVKTTVQEGLEFVPEGPLPVSQARPVGRRYFWRLRGCNDAGCTAWTEVRYVDVGRQSADYDGDGYADALVGSSGRAVAAVFLGGPTIDTRADLEMRYPAGDRVFLASAGDTNGDGYADFLIGYPGLDEAYLHLGRHPLRSTPDLTLRGPGPGQFGAGVAGAGDLDADGYADLLVGAPSDDRGGPFSSAHLFRGGANPDAASDVTLTFSRHDDDFGRILASARDINGDGFADILVASNGDTSLFLGSRAFDDRRDMVYRAFPVHESGLAAGDINGDGFPEIVIAAVAAPLIQIGSSQPRDYGTPISRAGTRASAGDLNGDGLADLLVGRNSDTVHVVLGKVNYTAIPDLELRPPATAEVYADAVGVVGDMNGDGFDDALVGAPLHSATAYARGRAYLFLGGSPMDTEFDLAFEGFAEEDLLGGAIAR
jgi:hypothetical protein